MAEPNDEPRVLQPGDIFRDHYLIEDKLGEGATGIVWRVRNGFTGDRLALKVGRIEDRRNAKKAARAVAEGRAGYDIRHRNVVAVLDLAVESDGTTWQIMELISGASLYELITRFGRLSAVYAVDICLEVAAGLHAAHELGVIHRDVQPANVFITDGGVVKLFDFSAAKVPGIKTTAGSRALFTAAFSAPEQWVEGAVLTPQVDVYAEGCLLSTLLGGRYTWEHALGNLALLFDRHQNHQPPSLVTAGLPAYCDDVVRGAMAKDPAERYAGMWAMMHALRELRARLVADIEAGRLVSDPSDCEIRYPIQRDPEGHHEYNPPKSLPGATAAPPLPSRRVVVTPPAQAAAFAKRAVAATVPMPAFGVVPAAAGPAGATSSPADAGAPTVRAPRVPARPPRRRWWLLLAAAPVMVLLGYGLTVATAAGTSPPPAASAPAVVSAPPPPPVVAAAPKASASAAPLGPRRPAAPRPRSTP